MRRITFKFNIEPNIFFLNLMSRISDLNLWSRILDHADAYLCVPEWLRSLWHIYVFIHVNVAMQLNIVYKTHDTGVCIYTCVNGPTTRINAHDSVELGCFKNRIYVIIRPTWWFYSQRLSQNLGPGISNYWSSH